MSACLDFTDSEREVARRELARMPDDLRRRVHGIAQGHGATTLDAMTFLIHQAQCAECAGPPS